MKLINFTNLKKKFNLTQSQAVDVCTWAKFKKAYTIKKTLRTAWKYDQVEISMLVKKLKLKLKT